MTTTAMKMNELEKELLTNSILRNKNQFPHAVLDVFTVTDSKVYIVSEFDGVSGKCMSYEHHGEIDFSKLDCPEPTTISACPPAEVRRYVRAA